MGTRIRAFAIWEPASLGSKSREDYLAIDLKTNSFVVADGVSLYKGIEYTSEYPRVLGSYRVARAFCRGFIGHFTKNLQDNVRKGFQAGNAAAGRVNKGRSKYDVFKKHKNLFAATAAMARIKGRVLEWGQMYDAGIAVIRENGKIKFKKDNPDRDFLYPPRDIKDYEDSTYTFFSRTVARNAISEKGKLLGHGVITGEPEAERYLGTGQHQLTKGDTVTLYTDGFTPYIDSSRFRKLLAAASSKEDLQFSIERFIKSKNKVASFQREKSLIIIYP